MAKRQSDKQSRLGKEMQATLDLWCAISDPEQKRELNDHYIMLRMEWEQAGSEIKFPHHDFDGNLIDNKKDKSQNGSD